jgi:helicase
VAFRGIFVGVDRYSSPDLPWLSCASRDAVALDALFRDTLGDGALLLVDEAATTENIRSALFDLETCDPDDVVVVYFSGHGAPSHHLIGHDTDPDHLDQTGFALEELTERFTSIPARRLLCILDCCFSGGMGAKVLMPDIRARGDLGTAEEALAKMSGQGRVVLTASSATQEAWENGRLGHGFLTYHLIDALVGAGGADKGSSLRLLGVLDQVTRAVVQAAEEIGREQHPTIRGTLEGDVVWPIFRRGAHYAAAFPNWAVAKATPDIHSLEPLGFPPALVDAWSGSISTLNDLQLAAINDHGVLAGRNLLVSAPTSSGKTMVGELAALKAAVERRRSIFLLPMRALVNDKFAAFTRTYAPFGIRTIRATGEIEDDIPDLLAGQFDICLMTNEKFAALALARPHLLDMVSLVVVDEAQLIADPGRGVALEFLLTMLKVRTAGTMPQVVLLSAVIGEAHGLDRWLDASLLVRTDRPVPLEEGVLRPNGDFRYLDNAKVERLEPTFIRPQFGRGSGQDWIIPLVKRLTDDGQQVIVFRATRSEARSVARYLAESLGLPAAQDAIDRLPSGDPSIASTDLRRSLARGVAFHISDLDRDERAVVEEEFRRNDSGLRVIVATTTLAMGVNTPASAVVIAGLQHPGQPGTPYSVAEYKNMVGRAGRLGLAEKGQSFLIATTAMDEHAGWTRYVTGTPEDITSRFPIEEGDPASVITRVLASAEGPTAIGLTAPEVIAFLTQSYAAFLRAQEDPAWSLNQARFDRALADLATNELVKADADGRYRLTDLGRLAGRSGTEVRSVLRLVGALKRVNPGAINEATLVTATQVTVELDEMRLPLNGKSKNKEPNAWPHELAQQGVPGSIVQALRMDAYDLRVATMRAKRAAACLLWMSDTPIERIERVLIQFGGGFDAAGPMRSVVSRTLDLLPTTIAVAEVLYPGLPAAERQSDLMTRLELGLPAALAPIGRLAGGSLGRPAYLSLARAGLAGLDDLAGAEDDTILAAVGGDARVVRAIRAALLKRGQEAVPLEIPLYDAS